MASIKDLYNDKGFMVFRLNSGGTIIDRIFTLVGEGNGILIYSQRKVVYVASTYHEISSSKIKSGKELPYITNIGDNSLRLFENLIKSGFRLIHHEPKSDIELPINSIHDKSIDDYKTIYTYRPQLYN